MLLSWSRRRSWTECVRVESSWALANSPPRPLPRHHFICISRPGAFTNAGARRLVGSEGGFVHHSRRLKSAQACCSPHCSGLTVCLNSTLNSGAVLTRCLCSSFNWNAVDLFKCVSCCSPPHSFYENMGIRLQTA